MPRRPVTLFACLALAAGGALAGCGSNDNSDSSGSSSPPPAAAPPPAASASSGKEVKVTMKNIKFVPAAITAKVGQKIVWTNTDGQTPHTVTATGGANFDSGTLPAGKTFEYTPTKAGKIDYVCTIHQGQSGTITVTK
jgi:plastocyanin